MTSGEFNRREFLKGSGTAAAVAAASPVLTAVPARAAGANDRIRFAVIGCGGQGRRSHIGRFPQGVNTEIAYVCDPDEDRRAQASGEAGGARPVDDLRRILDDTSVDAVTIATPDHWHTPAAILALDAGKHVYLEKPCSHNFREGRLLVEAARRSGRVLQHGTQARSSQGFVEAVQMLHEGVIGDVLVAKAWNVQKRRNIGRERPGPPPDGFDYDLWLGPAPRVPFQKNRHHYSWHWWYDFGTGDLGNDGVHEFDMARWGLGLDAHPTQVAVAGGKFFFDDDQEFPDTVTATFDYPGQGSVGERRQLVFEMRIWSANHPYDVDGGVEFLGTGGKMMFSRRGRFQLWDQENKRLDRRPEVMPKMDMTSNFLTWVKAIRGQTGLTADAETAHLSTSLCHLANIGVRVGRSIRFDPAAERIPGDDEADALLARTYRKGHWAIPGGA